MELEQLLLARRSVRHFTAEPVDPADLKKILAAGLSVPSSKNLHSSELVVVTDPEQVHALADCKPQFGQMLREAACAVVVLGATSSHAWVEDASLTLLAMLLQATELGLGSCWVQVRHMHAAALGADGKPSRLRITSEKNWAFRKGMKWKPFWPWAMLPIPCGPIRCRNWTGKRSIRSGSKAKSRPSQ